MVLSTCEHDLQLNALPRFCFHAERPIRERLAPNMPVSFHTVLFFFPLERYGHIWGITFANCALSVEAKIVRRSVELEIMLRQVLGEKREKIFCIRSDRISQRQKRDSRCTKVWGPRAEILTVIVFGREAMLYQLLDTMKPKLKHTLNIRKLAIVWSLITLGIFN